MRQLKTMGAPADVIAQATKQQAQTECLVFEDCWQSVQVFLAMASQWRVIAGMGGMFYQGIDFNAVEPCLRLMGIKKKLWSGIFSDLLIMQGEAASVINKRASSK